MSEKGKNIAQSGDFRDIRFGQINWRKADYKDGEEEKRMVEGYAALFDEMASIGGWYDEVIRAGAFTEALKKSDIRALFNHDPNLILARTASGTLEVMQDKKGLFYRFEVPNTTFGADFWEMLKRGDISQSSFAFTVERQRWEEKQDDQGNWYYTREILEVKQLYDVSPVTYPAYEGTSVAARSFEAFELVKQELEQQRQITQQGTNDIFQRQLDEKIKNLQHE